MERVRKLPSAFTRLQKIGGVIDFAVFDGPILTEGEIIAAIGSAIPQWSTFDAERLRALGNQRIPEERFWGDWYDPESGALIKRGVWRTDSGQELHNPVLRTLDRIKIVAGGFASPDPGSGGQFAYALTTPPHSLGARPGEVQELFDEIREFVVPSAHTSEILDWSNPRLPEAASYFTGGMEWWGVFLFSIYVPAIHRLTIAMASTTD